LPSGGSPAEKHRPRRQDFFPCWLRRTRKASLAGAPRRRPFVPAWNGTALRGGHECRPGRSSVRVCVGAPAKQVWRERLAGDLFVQLDETAFRRVPAEKYSHAGKASCQCVYTAPDKARERCTDDLSGDSAGKEKPRPRHRCYDPPPVTTSRRTLYSQGAPYSRTELVEDCGQRKKPACEVPEI